MADASRETALRSLFRLKTRPETKPVPLFIDSLDRLDGIVERYPPGFDKLVQAFWPGPLTIVLPACRGVPDIVTAGTGTVAVRLPHSPLVRSLVRLSRQALTGTSGFATSPRPFRVRRQAGVRCCSVAEQAGELKCRCTARAPLDGTRRRQAALFLMPVLSGTVQAQSFHDC